MSVTVITDMFIMATEDGRFINISSSTTHTGFHVHMEIVDHIEQASVYHAPRLMFRHEANSLHGMKVNWLPVRITRTVELLAYGVENEPGNGVLNHRS